MAGGLPTPGGGEKLSVPIVITMLRDDVDPVHRADVLRLYDTRFAKPRATEWRAYYPAGGAAERTISMADEGDLAVFGVAPGRPLTFLIAARGSSWEATLLHLLDVQQLPDDGLEVLPPVADSGAVRALRLLLAELDDAVTAEAQPTLFDGLESESDETVAQDGQLSLLPEPTVARERTAAYIPGRLKDDLLVWLSGRLDLSPEGFEFPSTLEMATVGQELAEPADTPDEMLVNWLEAETLVFEVLEELDGERRLEAAATFSDKQDLFRSLANRRMSRRGYSLEHHVARLLEDHGIQFEAQVETEPGSVADFIIPSLAAYRDPDFPEDRLFHIAAKSTVRERWRQVLEEARRVPVKYLVTLDAGISHRAHDAMRSSGVRVVLPEPLQALAASDPALTARQLMELLARRAC